MQDLGNNNLIILDPLQNIYEIYYVFIKIRRKNIIKHFCPKHLKISN